MGATIITTVDRTREIQAAVESFKRDSVLVGIPEDKGPRRDDDPINNATILWINEFGSPVNNIPASHPLSTGLKLAQPEIVDEFRKAAIKCLSGGLGALQLYYNRIGIIASQSVKSTINNQIDMLPPSEATMARRAAAGFKGVKRLIVTGQMRNAITYVLTGRW